MIGGSLAKEYLQFRRDNITAVVAAVSEQARKVRPEIEISAAVFWHWPSVRDSIGQDWKMWAEKGYIDWVCPMQYTHDVQLFDAQCVQTKGWVGSHAKLLPGIGATLGQTPDGTLQQVLITRKHKADGFVLFNYSRSLLPHLRLLKLGATKRP